MEEEIKTMNAMKRWLDKLPSVSAKLRVLRYLSDAVLEAGEPAAQHPPDPRQLSLAD